MPKWARFSTFHDDLPQTFVLRRQADSGKYMRANKADMADKAHMADMTDKADKATSLTTS